MSSHPDHCYGAGAVPVSQYQGAAGRAPVDKEVFQDLEKTIGIMQERISVLTSKIEPILTPEGPAIARPTDGSGSGLRRLQRDLASAVGRIETLLDRIEL
jgi:hypothetical protein